MTFKAAEIEEPPNFGASINTNYILGMAKAGAKVKILLDIDQALQQ